MIRLIGYAAVYGQKVKIGDDYEVIDKGAFDFADLSDVSLVYNHGETAYAKTKFKNLVLIPDKKGLKIIATLSKNKSSVEVEESVKSGQLSKMSFRADVTEFKTRTVKGVKATRIKRIGKVYDVSIVDNPVYPGTYVEAENG